MYEIKKIFNILIKYFLVFVCFSVFVVDMDEFNSYFFNDINNVYVGSKWGLYYNMK